MHVKMRYFRIPGFTGIESHREDLDRGSLSKSQNCINVPSGGLRSAPVWETLKDLPSVSGSNVNKVYWSESDRGGNILLVTREDEFHDIAVNTGHSDDIDEIFRNLTDFTALEAVSIGEDGEEINESALPLTEGPALFSNLGGGRLALADGTPLLDLSPPLNNPLVVSTGENPPKGVFGRLDLDPKGDFYKLENASFEECSFFVVSKFCVFASGSRNHPLTIFVSEPSGLSGKEKWSMGTTHNHDGVRGYQDHHLSKVDLLMTSANRITGLSVDRFGNVLVHTDNGVYQLTPPTNNQAFTGYRTEQRNTSPLSGSLNFKTAVGSQQSMPIYFGHDGQLYDLDKVTIGPEGKPNESDEDQVSWKAKGAWEREHPKNKRGSFAVYNAESGLYWVFIPTKGYDEFLSFQDLLPTTNRCDAGELAGSIPSRPRFLRGVSSPAAPSWTAGASSPLAPSDLAGAQVPNAPYFFSGLSTPARPTLFGATPARPSLFSGPPNKPTWVSGETV